MTLFLHVVPPQQASPGSPHAQVPLEQVRFAPQREPQHGPLSAPHVVQLPLTHWNPGPHAGLHDALAAASKLPSPVDTFPPSPTVASFDEVAPSETDASKLGSMTPVVDAPGGGGATMVPFETSGGSAQ